MRRKPGLSPIVWVRFLAVELVALLASILLIILIGGIAVSMAGYFYDINPAPGEDDLGAGLIVATAVFGSLLISLPGSVLIHVYAFKKFFSKEAKK